MAGWIFVLLLPGVLISALLALGLADARWRHDLDLAHMERAADRTSDFVNLLNATPQSERAALAARFGPDVKPVSGDAIATTAAPAFALLLKARLHQPAVVAAAPPGACWGSPAPFRLQARRGRALLDARMRPPQCWIVGVTLADGSPARLAISAPPVISDEREVDPLYLTVLAVGVAIVAGVVARVAAAPINALGRAARALGADLNRAPLPETGPTEVRDAAAAFNAMQRRLQSSLNERTQMLGFITHDLQTPVTRLRLRLEKVDDEALRARLLADLAAMQSLIAEGLELARSAETTEPFAVVDVDAMLESLVADAAELGGRAGLADRCGIDVRARPLALRRGLSNLIDNALKYGGDAEVSAARRPEGLAIVVRDHGPGIPEDELARVLEPFVRLETSRSRETGGSGLGLAIARTLAEKCHGGLALRNHPQGGLEATLTLEVAEPKRPARSTRSRRREDVG
jgi:signal transduction histidine kinase